ncbi:hypothetical protein PGB90_001404 [Kerria lacca]
MGITWKTDLPKAEELETPEIPFSGVILRAGAFHLGKYCENKNDEFMLCRQELGPRHCISEGKEVTNCTFEFFGKLKKLCYEHLDRYANCLEKSSNDLNYMPCRKTQLALDKCVFENLGIERPEFAYYTRPRIYNSVRPAPETKVTVFDDVPIKPEGPDFPPKKEAIFNSRAYSFK